jgi:hypothetical protein
MVGDCGHHTGVHIRRGAQLEWHAAVTYECSETAEAFTVWPRLDVIDYAHPMAKACRTAVLEGLPDARQTECLASMNGGVKVLPLHELKSIEVA